MDLEHRHLHKWIDAACVVSRSKGHSADDTCVACGPTLSSNSVVIGIVECGVSLWRPLPAATDAKSKDKNAPPVANIVPGPTFQAVATALLVLLHKV
eukprot:28774-Amphidinium_carterae.1